MRRGRRVRSFSDSESVEPPDLSDTEDLSFSETTNRSFIITYILYLIVGICTNLIGKQLLTFFPFTRTVTMVQLMCTFIFSIPACRLLNIPSVRYKDLRSFWIFFAVLGLTVGKFSFQFATQQSISFNTVSFTHTVKSSMPIFTVLFERVISRHHSLPVYASLLPIVLGVGIASYTESQFDMRGFVWALVATGVFSIQNIGSKLFMDKTRIHTLRLLSILAGLSSALFFNIWFYSDWIAFQIAKKPISSRTPSVTAIYLFGDGFFNFLQNFLAFRMIGMVTPLTYSVFNVLKRLIVIAASIAFFKNPVTITNGIGMIMAISGVWFYNKAKIREKRLERRKRPLLPMVNTDTREARNGHIASFTGNAKLPEDTGSKTVDLKSSARDFENSLLFIPESPTRNNQGSPRLNLAV